MTKTEIIREIEKIESLVRGQSYLDTFTMMERIEGIARKVLMATGHMKKSSHKTRGGLNPNEK